MLERGCVCGGDGETGGMRMVAVRSAMRCNFCGEGAEDGTCRSRAWRVGHGRAAGSWDNFVRDASTVLHSDGAGCLGLEGSIVLLVCRRKMSLSN